jgi:hypothetical protein
VLRINDFPTGWSTSPDDSDNSDSKKQDAELAHCLNVPLGEISGPAGKDEAEVDTPDFNAPGGNPSTSEDVSISTTHEETQEMNVLSQSSASGCLSTYLNELLKMELSSDKSTKGVTVGHLTVGNVSFPTLGDQTVAFRASVPISGEGISISVYVDPIFMRLGNASVAMFYVSEGSPFDPAMEVSTARKAMKKLREAHVPVT